jgi:dTDP-4-amino-4,6-dideoxygalactose transaminase
MAVHLGGWPCDMNEIVALAEEKERRGRPLYFYVLNGKNILEDIENGI